MVGRKSSIRSILSIVIVLLVVGFVIILLINNSAGDQTVDTLRTEILKSIVTTLLQLILIGIIGVFVQHLFTTLQKQADKAKEKAMLDQERRQAKNELRREFLQRLVATNRSVRKARLLIAAYGSAKKYGEQMQVIIDAKLELNDLEHNIKNLPRLFHDQNTLKEALHQMYKYLDDLTKEYKNSYKDILNEEKNDRQKVISSIENLPECGPFIKDNNIDDIYNEKYLTNYWKVLDEVRQQIKDDDFATE